MNPITKCEKILGITTGILVGIEAIASFIVSTICIVYYYKYEDVDTSLPISVLRAIHLRFLDYKHTYDYEIASQKILIHPSAFICFNFIYVIFDVMWLYISCNFVFVVVKKTTNIRLCIRNFFFMTHVVCITDLILVVCLGIDHTKTCTGSIPELESELCDKALIPVLITSAKGFVLWILNVGLAWACMMKDFGRPPPSEEDESPVPYYSDVTTFTNFSSSYEPRLRLEYRYAFRYNGFDYGYSYGWDWVRS